ncbi:MAG: PAS domain-containing sensor histidine kinase [Gemmatimonadota bacterium]|nr:PAS domain-containing sensor histidine kinase [Gemmatimonadota bacterium]
MARRTNEPDSARRTEIERDGTGSARDPVAGVPARETDGLYRLLVESIHDYAIFALDPNGFIVSWNVGAQRMKGYSADEIIGQHFSIFYPQAKIDEGFPDYELTVASKEGRFEDEGWRIRKGGSQFWCNVVITALRDASGKLAGFAKVTRDLTERRATELEHVAHAKRTAAAEGSNRTKSEFLATLSHELRTPLNAIGGYTDLLAEGIYGPVTGEQNDAFRRIRRSQQHLLSIISDLLNYSKIESGKFSYDITAVPMFAVIETVTPMIEPQATKKGIAFERGPCAEDAMAQVDQARTEQILLNLLSNAVKFTPSGGRVIVTCDIVGDNVAIRVRDTGPGIPSDKLDAIFEPFVQLGRSLTTGHEGTGLGLAISRDLARAMGGDLTADKPPGEGALFTLTLPGAISVSHPSADWSGQR